MRRLQLERLEARNLLTVPFTFFDDHTLALQADNPPGISEPAIPMFHNGKPLGDQRYQVIEAFDQVPGTANFPLTFVDLAANTFVRGTYQKPAGTTGALGTSLVASPSLRTADNRFRYIPEVTRADITTGGNVRFENTVSGRFATLGEVRTTRTYYEPVVEQTRFDLSVRFDAATDIRLATGASFTGNDRFRVLTASTMFADSLQYDANVIRFQDARGRIQELRLTDATPRDRHLFPTALEIGHWFELIKTDGSTWYPDSPTTHVQIDGDGGLRLGLQGFLARTKNPNDDSLSVWLEWLDAPDVVARDTAFDVRFAVNSRPPGEVEMPLAGDFDDSGKLDVTDIDLLSAAVRAEVYDPSFDLNHDGRLDADDRDAWVHDLRDTWFGDANLDSQFNSDDFVQVFQQGEYEDLIKGNSGWADGDWDGNADFESADFVRVFQDGGYEQGPRNNAVMVPEPSAPALWIVGVAFWAYDQQMRRAARQESSRHQEVLVRRVPTS